MPLFQKASLVAVCAFSFHPQLCLISKQGQIKYANTQQVSPLLFIRKPFSSVQVQSSVNSQTNDCPCYWHSTPVIKHLSESALAQLCEFSSGRCCVLCLEYMGVDLCALVGCFKINALQHTGTFNGKSSETSFGRWWW